MIKYCIVLLLLLNVQDVFAQQNSFVTVSHHSFYQSGSPYYYTGANYWYGGLLALAKNKSKGFARLQSELDFLCSKGVTNLRVMVGSEGSGQINGKQRVEPALQPAKGVFAADNLKGLDVLLAEMGKRNMKAVLFLSNNWEWTGGFLQYLNWNGMLADSVLRRKLNWDEMRDIVSKFYTCNACMEDYKKQVSFVLHRTNTITGKKYTNDAAIMAWELANEPRPMRPVAASAFRKWIAASAAFIKSIDKNHLVTLGTEGEIGMENMPLYEAIHADKNVDYLTIHIWPKNWGWFQDTAVQSGLQDVISKTQDYIQKHVAIAQKLQKPLVLEEFGLPRDGQSFSPTSPTTARDAYYNIILSGWQKSALESGVIGGVNFWGFGGTARPHDGQVFWKPGDNYMADPPMEEQGLNTVFDNDQSTWNHIYSYTSRLRQNPRQPFPHQINRPQKKRAFFKNNRKNY